MCHHTSGESLQRHRSRTTVICHHITGEGSCSNRRKELVGVNISVVFHYHLQCWRSEIVVSLIFFFITQVNKKHLNVCLTTDPLIKKHVLSAKSIFKQLVSMHFFDISCFKITNFIILSNFFYSPNDESKRKLKCMSGFWYVLWVRLIVHMETRSFLL